MTPLTAEDMKPIKHATDPNRIGVFSINEDWVRFRWRDLIPVFASLVVLKSDWNPANRTIRYAAFSDHFEEVCYGTQAPEYIAIMSKVGILRWEKVESHNSTIQCSSTKEVYLNEHGVDRWFEFDPKGDL